MLNSLLKYRFFRRYYHVYERTIPFVKVCFGKDGFSSRDGRILIWGKFRRLCISAIPPLARALQKHYKIHGGCTSCGTSCKLMFQCPHWDDKTHLCSVYEDRPNICRFFPITPSDIRDRNIINKKEPCGFTFEGPNPKH